jgi:hypothetical protein
MAKKTSKRKLKSPSNRPKLWIKICKRCNNTFESISVKGKKQYCDSCLKAIRVENGKRYFEPKKKYCERCSEPYVATGSASKYCEPCRKKLDYERTVKYREKKRKEKYWNSS